MEINSNVDHAGASRGPRHSILDLAPLELECMTVLWPLGAGTVREIHHRLALSRPRAYTTVLTIMDRLAQKGIVTRRKVGRAYRYEPRLSVEEARLNAVGKIVDGFFEGSPQALAAHLSQGGASPRLPGEAPLSGVQVPQPPAASSKDSDRQALVYPDRGRVYPEARGVGPGSRSVNPERQGGSRQDVDPPGTSPTESPSQNLDDTLL